MTCPKGYFCTEGTSTPSPCRNGTYGSATGLTNQRGCLQCPEGSACPTGAAAPRACSPGTVAPQGGMDQCRDCPAGSFQSASNRTMCDVCSRGAFCEAGASAALPCASGTYGNTSGLESSADCQPCPKVRPRTLTLALILSPSPYNPNSNLHHIPHTQPNPHPNPNPNPNPTQGHSCPAGSEQPSKCTPGSFANQTTSSRCLRCAAGTYQSGEGNETGCDICPESAWCAAGSSAPTPCAAGTYGGRPGLQFAENCTACPTGSWCSAGVLIPCGNATYNDQRSASHQGYCKQCPPNAGSVQGASRVDECECNAGYYNAGNASEIACVLCGTGTMCEVSGVTVATLPLAAGYWRLGTESTEIKRCPDAAHAGGSACVGGTGTSAPAATRRQLGSSSVCRASTTGPYCQVCDDETMDGSGNLYYSHSTATCKECSGDLAVPISTVVGIAVVLAGLGALYYAYMPHRRVPWLRMLLLRGSTMVAAFSLRAKAKQCVGFYQVRHHLYPYLYLSLGREACILRLKGIGQLID